jgi:hypothetical protein
MRIKSTKNWFFAILAAAVCALAIAGCDDPVKAETENGPSNGTPFVFENQSSVMVTVAPNSDFPDQGWLSFNLTVGASKTVYVSWGYDTIYYLYSPANLVTSTSVSGEDKVVFVNK